MEGAVTRPFRRGEPGYDDFVYKDVDYKFYGWVANMYVKYGGDEFTFQTPQLGAFFPYYQNRTGFYWGCVINDCGRNHLHTLNNVNQIHFSFLPHYRNYGSDDYALNETNGAICPHDVRIFLVMMKCKKVHANTYVATRNSCDRSEFFEQSAISIDDIGDSQSGIVNEAVYHQIYCVPEYTRPIPVKQVIVGQ